MLQLLIAMYKIGYRSAEHALSRKYGHNIIVATNRELEVDAKPHAAAMIEKEPQLLHYHEIPNHTLAALTEIEDSARTGLVSMERFRAISHEA